MKLRKLDYADMPFMMEWMHDENVVCHMEKDFSSMEMCDCKHFIEMSLNNEKDLHLAVVDEQNEYMGTVSLKNINHNSKSAEFAITIRFCAMGKGYSQFAMKEMLKIGFEEIGLKTIYWYVSKDNKRAISFYDKNNYPRIGREQLIDTCNDECISNKGHNLLWYAIENRGVANYL